VSAGSLGLVEAARRFDASEGASFPTFARHRIRGAIVDSLRRIDPLSRRLRSFQRAASQATETLTMTLGRHPSDFEVAAHVGLSACRFERLARELHESGGAVNGVARKDTAVCPVDQLPAKSRDPERLAEVAELRDTLNTALGMLPRRYRAVIRWYHFEGLTMKRIAERLGVSEGRVSQIHSCAIRHLQGHPRLRMHA
jgi:RNA polymerase sigma factor for flagellar operon FliA